MNYKFFRVALCFVLLLSCFSVFSFADTDSSSPEDGASEPVEIFQSDNLPNNITVVVNRDDNSDRISALEDAINALGDSDNLPLLDEVGLELKSVSVSSERVSASDATGFKSVLLGLLGDYDTIITDYEYRNNNNTYTSHSIAITQDYTWLASAAVFGLVVFCFFRLIGGFLCNR